MARYTYLLLMVATLLPFLFKMKDPQLALHRRLRSAVTAMLLVALPFLVWDVYATATGHWSFSDEYTLGVHILNLPFEEVLFFVAVPLVSILVWETVGYFLKR